MPYGKRDFEADDAREVEDRVKRAQARQALLNYVRDTVRPTLDQTFISIVNSLRSLLEHQDQENAFLRNYILPMVNALQNFCTEVFAAKDLLSMQALANLKPEDVFGATEDSLNSVCLVANAARLIHAVIEDIKKPEINLNDVHQKLKIIEKIATKLDDPQSVAKRKLAGALGIAGLALLALAVVAIMVVSLAFPVISIPVMVGLMFGGAAFGAITTAVAIKGMNMRNDVDYQPTPLSRSLHLFRDVVKDGLVGKTASARCEEYQLCRNMR